jgi:release factor glutamine methyltransferase
MPISNPPPPVTVGQVLHTAERALAVSSDSARLDAELLLEFVTSRSRANLRADAGVALSAAELLRFADLVRRRAAGEPVAYIIGTQGFWTLVLEVNRDVLIPRPETELLVERGIAHLRGRSEVRILDLGTGSGAVALALANESPQGTVVATDNSVAALRVAERNARTLKLNVRFVCGDWFAPLKDERFDLIVSNPPYIEPDDPDLSATVRNFEPHGALFAAEGLAALEHIIRLAPRHLESGGWLALEHGWRQGPRVRELLLQSGFTQVRSHADLAGHERVTEGTFVK